MKKVFLIAAYAHNHVIGSNGSIPWNIPGEQSRFRKLTTGNVVIMGRKTFDEIFQKLKKPLPGRINIIISKTKTYSMISICIPEKDNIERKLDIIRKEIIGNPELEISIADMSEKANVSSFHMIRKFSSENGLTPHKFQLQCRIRKAQELLQNGMKVVDVAAAVGFCDQSHLCRVFKKQVGITPEEYIKSAILSKPDKN